MIQIQCNFQYSWITEMNLLYNFIDNSTTSAAPTVLFHHETPTPRKMPMDRFIVRHSPKHPRLHPRSLGFSSTGAGAVPGADTHTPQRRVVCVCTTSEVQKNEVWTARHIPASLQAKGDKLQTNRSGRSKSAAPSSFWSSGAATFDQSWERRGLKPLGVCLYK